MAYLKQLFVVYMIVAPLYRLDVGMVDKIDLKSVVQLDVWVRVPLEVQILIL